MVLPNINKPVNKATSNFFKFRSQQYQYAKSIQPKPIKNFKYNKQSQKKVIVQSTSTLPIGYVPLGYLHKEADDAANIFP